MKATIDPLWVLWNIAAIMLMSTHALFINDNSGDNPSDPAMVLQVPSYSYMYLFIYVLQGNSFSQR